MLAAVPAVPYSESGNAHSGAACRKKISCSRPSRKYGCGQVIVSVIRLFAHAPPESTSTRPLR